MTNETLNTILTRRSCRKFKPDMITEEELQAVIEAGKFAPNGKGLQAGMIIAVTNKQIRDMISVVNCKIGGWADGFDPFYGAPVICIILADKTVPTHVYDGSLVAGNMMNAAASIGLGSIWIHRAKQEFDSDFGKSILKELGIEGEWEGIGHVALGYEDGPCAEAKERKENFVYYIR